MTESEFPFVGELPTTISAINLNVVREDICCKLRNSDLMSTTIRGVTTVTESSTASVGQSFVTPGNSGLKNVRSLTIDGTDIYFLKDFSINFKTGVISLYASLSGGEAIVLEYDYGPDRIFPDMPRENLKLESFPRIGIKVISMSSEPLGLGAKSFISDIIVSIYVWMPVDKVSTIAGGLGGNDDLEFYMSAVRSCIINNSQFFFSFPFIYPVGASPIIPGQNNKIVQMSQDFKARFVVEN